MFVFLQLEFSVRYGLLLVLDHALELFQLVVEAGERGSFFLQLLFGFGMGSLG
jgi:hypothetical protein